jgi:predicted Zn-dependent protease
VDAAIGKTAGEATRKQHGLGKAPTPEQVERVERIFDELRKGLTPEEARILVAPRVTTVVDPQVNAFALPGGEVFVLTGLLDRVKDDDDLIRGVLAHELGHAVHRHGVRSLARNGVYGMALSLFLGDIDGIAATIIAGASKLDTLQYSRSMEEEADDFGVDLLLRIGRDPDGLARFMESLEAAPVPELLSTHPDSKARAESIRKKLKEKQLPAKN